MLLSPKQIISESLECYKKNFRALSNYLIFSSLSFFGMCFLSFLPTFFALAFSNSKYSLAISIFGISLTLVFLALSTILYFKIMIGFEFQLRRALDKKKLLTFRETLAETKTVMWTAIGTSILSNMVTTLPLVAGILGIFVKNRVSILESLDVIEKGVSPQIHIEGISGYFFLFLSIYGALHLLYFSVIYSMSYYSVLFKNKKVVESLEYSQSLVTGRWKQVWWRFFVPQAILLGIYWTLMLFSFVIEKKFGQSAGQISDMLVAVIINFVVAVPLVYLPALILFNTLQKNPVKK